jgi:hypothetical protein
MLTSRVGGFLRDGTHDDAALQGVSRRRCATTLHIESPSVQSSQPRAGGAVVGGIQFDTKPFAAKLGGGDQCRA